MPGRHYRCVTPNHRDTKNAKIRLTLTFRSNALTTNILKCESKNVLPPFTLIYPHRFINIEEYIIVNKIQIQK